MRKTTNRTTLYKKVKTSQGVSFRKVGVKTTSAKTKTTKRKKK